MGIYYWGAATGVPAHLLRLESEDDESEALKPIPADRCRRFLIFTQGTSP
jgi:hypothetical protein